LQFVGLHDWRRHVVAIVVVDVVPVVMVVDVVLVVATATIVAETREALPIVAPPSGSSRSFGFGPAVPT
jgi:hypothetical protein